MARTENPDLQLLEERQIRMAKARAELARLVERLGFISNRVPYLPETLDTACAEAARALALVSEEWEKLREERNGGGQ